MENKNDIYTSKICYLFKKELISSKSFKTTLILAIIIHLIVRVLTIIDLNILHHHKC